MPLSILFWVLFIIWVVLGVGWNWNRDHLISTGSPLILVLLVFVIGWQVFGFIVNNGGRRQ